MVEIIEPNRNFKASLGTEVFEKDKVYINRGIEISRVLEKIEVKKDENKNESD